MDSRKKGRCYIYWADQMDKALLDVFVEHYNKGDRAQNGWKPHVYTAAVKNVRETCELEITKENIISRSKTFDKYYTIVNNMLLQSGFGWDWENNKIMVDSDDIWNPGVVEVGEQMAQRGGVGESGGMAVAGLKSLHLQGRGRRGLTVEWKLAGAEESRERERERERDTLTEGRTLGKESRSEWKSWDGELEEDEEASTQSTTAATAS